MEKNNLPHKEKLRTLFEHTGLLAVYLFGSRAEGTANTQSDYDFAILVDFSSPMDDLAFTALDLEEKLAAILNTEVDIITLNTADIEHKFLIISRGVLIYSSDDDKRTDFEDIAIKEYLDFKPVLELYRKDFREAIQEGDFYA